MTEFTLSLPIRVALIEAESVRVTDDRSAYEQLERCAAEYREKYGQMQLGSIPGIQTGRQLFRSLGIDPTKHRPSSEALLNRALKQKSLYSVNSLVDVANWCALDFLLPNGAYDRRKISGNIVLRKGMPGESYIGLNHNVVNLHNRYTLVDDRGPFGSPITDSARTSINEQTTVTLFIIFSPADFDMERLRNFAGTMAERITTYCYGEIYQLKILDGNETKKSRVALNRSDVKREM